MLNEIIKRIIRFIPGFFATAFAFVSVFTAAPERLETMINQQTERIEALETAYKNGEIPSVDEDAFFAGDLQTEIDSGMKFNELSFLATHNSYQSPATRETKLLFQGLSDITFGIVSENYTDFYSQTLTEQLNCGLRSFEIDIETFERSGEISFTCMHSPYFEMATHCYDFSLALKEISMWSDNNPDHLPITIIIEPKSVFVPLKDMKYFNIDYAKAMDEILRKELGDKLFTPNDMLGDYSSFAELRADDSWSEVGDMLGKVLVILHDCSVTEEYIAIDPAIRTQAMFPMLRSNDINRDCASFILENSPKKLTQSKNELITEGNTIIRTRADEFGNISAEKLELALASGAHIISTDYPVRTDLEPDDYVVTFEEKATVKRIK